MQGSGGVRRDAEAIIARVGEGGIAEGERRESRVKEYRAVHTSAAKALASLSEIVLFSFSI